MTPTGTDGAQYAAINVAVESTVRGTKSKERADSFEEEEHSEGGNSVVSNSAVSRTV